LTRGHSLFRFAILASSQSQGRRNPPPVRPSVIPARSYRREPGLRGGSASHLSEGTDQVVAIALGETNAALARRTGKAAAGSSAEFSEAEERGAVWVTPHLLDHRPIPAGENRPSLKGPMGRSSACNVFAAFSSEIGYLEWIERSVAPTKTMRREDARSSRLGARVSEPWPGCEASWAGLLG
jgi:hypothetical protein